MVFKQYLLRRLFYFCVISLSIFSLLACNKNQNKHKPVASEFFPAGSASVSALPFPSFIRPVKNLPEKDRPNYYAGKALATQPWIKAPTVTDARDGLGPLYNARSCLTCHKNGGRGGLPNGTDLIVSNPVVKLSLPGSDPKTGAIPEPTYGDQFQTQSVSLAHQLKQLEIESNSNALKAEGELSLQWNTMVFEYPDGNRTELRKPSIHFNTLHYGDLHADARIEIRNAPPIHGLGLIELIKQSDISALADPNDKNNDGISGRVNTVWSVSLQKNLPGRFGLKSNKATLIDVTAHAFVNDIGITNTLFPNQPCSSVQTQCHLMPNGNDENGVEINNALLKLTNYFVQNIGVPERNSKHAKNYAEGKSLFFEVGCNSCHQPNYTTSSSTLLPHLSNLNIWPYSDFLLHDMGAGLQSERTDFEASESEWRTPPLWGIGFTEAVNGNKTFLHDGRARNIEEAILWHGGEAMHVKNRFAQLALSKRKKLITFVESL